MRSPSAFFCLPTSLLLLTSGYLADALCLEAQWPYNLPPHMKYFPNDEPLVRRNGEIQERIARQSPSAVRRMSTDEGEMFLLEYWQFADELGGSADIAGSLSRRNINCKGLLADSWVNKTTAGCLQPPLLSHESERVRKASLLARYLPPAVARLYARDFVCPSGTSNCSSIGQPNSCCGIGLTCNTVPDTGLGVVGCCAGSSCAGQVATCPEGYGTCPSSQGGGCCIPGYVCSGVGCVLASTATVVVYQTISVSVPRGTSTIALATATTTSTLIASPASTTTSTTSTPSLSASITCSSGFQSCPANLGGGCCSSDRLCGTGIVCPPTSTSTPSTTSTTSIPAAVGPPIRPTSVASLLTTTITNSVCPTGFYQCSAYYNGGNCCQVGRDCGLTSCPPHVSSTAFVSDSVTIVDAPTAGVATATNVAAVQGKTCATGWFLCGTQTNEGCCPNGYSCSGTECLAGTNVAATGASASVLQEAASNGVTRCKIRRHFHWMTVVMVSVMLLVH